MKYANTKIKILSPQHSEAFQKAVFAEGGSWWSGSTEVKLTKEKCIVVDTLGRMRLLGARESFAAREEDEITFDMDKTFNFPNDLKDFMIVEHKNGQVGLVINDYIIYENNFKRISSFYFDVAEGWAVEKVYGPERSPKNFKAILCKGPLLWEREAANTKIKETQRKISLIEQKQRALADELEALKKNL